MGIRGRHEIGKATTQASLNIFLLGQVGNRVTLKKPLLGAENPGEIFINGYVLPR